MVQFRAMVTPCMPTCPPVTCDVLDYTGQSRQVESYGRKKRSSALIEADQHHHNVAKRQADPEEVLVVQTLRIVDKNRKLNEGMYDFQCFHLLKEVIFLQLLSLFNIFF